MTTTLATDNPHNLMENQNETQVAVQEPRASQAVVDNAKARALEFVNPETWKMMTLMANTFMQSGALPASIKNAAQLIMVMQAGHEAGMKPVEAMGAFYFVNGKLSMYGEMAIAQVLRHGHKVKWGECNDRTATVTVTRGDDESVSLTTTFTMEMARARGLTNNPVYQKFPENMLKFKAFHMTARFVCPEALHGVPIKEDLEGSIEVTAEVVDVPAPQDVEPKKEPAKKARKTARADVEMEESAPPETDDERYKRLVADELDGKAVSVEDKAFLNAYVQRKRDIPPAV